MKKRGQFWYADFMIAVVILMVIGLLFVVSIKDLTSRNEIIKDLILDASEVSSIIMSEGNGDYSDWKNGEGSIGFVTNYKLDINKFNNFLKIADYNTQKSMLGTFYDVWIYLADKEGNIIDHNGFGPSKPGVGSITDIDANNLVHIKRFIFYENDIHILGVVLWN